MVTKSYLYTPEAVAAMDAIEIELCFDFGEDDLIFGFSPDSLRNACDGNKALTAFLADKLANRVALANDDDTVQLERPGYLVPMSDRSFVKRLSCIAKECVGGVWNPGDYDETGYGPYHAERARKRALRNKPVEKVQDEAVEPLAAPEKVEESSDQVDGQADDMLSAADPVYLKAPMYDGQLNVSLLFCGSQLLSGSRAPRGDYSAKNPLVVSRISGIKSGTTTVSYQGEELRTPDVETWVAIVRLGSKLPLGTPVHLREGQLLKTLRRTDGHLNYLALREQLERLQNAKLIIETEHAKLIKSIAAALPEDVEAQQALETGKLRITVSLLGDSSTSTPKKRGCHLVHLPPHVRALFGPGLSSWFREDAYYGLKGPTARRLYLLYGRHVDPRPFTLPELREYLGMTTDRDDKLLAAIEDAHKEMFEKGYLVGDSAPEYSTNYPKTKGGFGGGLKRNGQKAYAIALVPKWAPKA